MLGTDADEQQWPVELWVYDLSQGLARQLSMGLLGRSFDAIYHTSLVVYGREYFYGQGVDVTTPGHSHHGQPQEKIDMGYTSVDPDTWNELLQDLRERFTASKYHLLEHNCNTFTNECMQILTGREIPARITNLPADFLSTPFGMMMRPQIDAMFRPANTNHLPVAPTTAGPGPSSALLNVVANRAFAGNMDDKQHVPTPPAATEKNLRSCTSDASSFSMPPVAVHPHDKIQLASYADSSEATWTRPSRWDAKLNYRTVLSRIDAAISACPAAATSFSIKAELQDAERIYRSSVIPALERAALSSTAISLDSNRLADLQRANATLSTHFSTMAIFPLVELVRSVALTTPDTLAWTSVSRTEVAFGKHLAELLHDKPKNQDGSLKGVKVLQSGLRMIANGFSHTGATLPNAALPLPSARSLIVEGVLHPHGDVREAAASAIWNMCLLNETQRGQLLDAEAVSELCCALIEAVKSEDMSALASAKLLALLLRALIKLLHKSLYWEETLDQLLQVLELDTILAGKVALLNKLDGDEQRSQLQHLITDIRALYANS